jgi:hypothetical protein
MKFRRSNVFFQYSSQIKKKHYWDISYVVKTAPKTAIFDNFMESLLIEYEISEVDRKIFYFYTVL